MGLTDRAPWLPSYGPYDPELERLLAEEDHIERMLAEDEVQSAQPAADDTWVVVPSAGHSVWACPDMKKCGAHA